MEKKMFAYINKMSKKSLKEIKKDFNIKSKNDAIDLFGLDKTLTTKQVNNFLRSQYKLLQKEVNKVEKQKRKLKTKKAKHQS